MGPSLILFFYSCCLISTKLIVFMHKIIKEINVYLHFSHFVLVASGLVEHSKLDYYVKHGKQFKFKFK